MKAKCGPSFWRKAEDRSTICGCLPEGSRRGAIMASLYLNVTEMP